MAGRRRRLKGKRGLKVRKINKSRKKKELRFKEVQSSGLARGNGENVCMVCGGETYDVHCKKVCRNCGYTRDCSDP